MIKAQLYCLKNKRDIFELSFEVKNKYKLKSSKIINKKQNITSILGLPYPASNS